MSLRWIKRFAQMMVFLWIAGAALIGAVVLTVMIGWPWNALIVIFIVTAAIAVAYANDQRP